ncbi:13197_t:CDS:2 [Ambispora leptoticha]|uniref:13197_t:CDS:1 n=1 Tax=Ambispora leptoticha TaxID=144679 RepID=A0A9N9HRH1_9GLOM|nr:13197_t:CDS:2 [Ambispora leptoticha]
MAQNESDSEHSEHEELYEESTTTNQSKGRPKSFVWDYFDKDNNGITVICKVILDNGKKCGVSYNDGSTTSNLINHLAPIVYLPSRLQSDESAPVRKDGERLARIMLSDDEWIFLDELNDILCGFEEITTLLSGNTYVTISLMYPAISTLVKTLKILLQQSYIESASTDMGELTILDSVEEIIDDTKDIVEIKEVDASLGIIHKTINISVPMITIGMLEKVKKVLYDSMYHYWNSVTDVGMLACLLDPRFKKLRFANTNVVIQTKEHLKSLYELECEIHPTPKRPTSLSNIQHDDHNDFEAALEEEGR